MVRTALGGFLAFAGVSHLTFARDEFQAQVPEFVPLDTDTKRFVRLFFQPVLIAAALWSTGALRDRRR
ncbi:hypothetical protein D8M38_04225 [Kocuria sp. HSID17582]|nr:hypothetical protein D8M39_00140 [Kocuria sp. HSID17590]RUQ10663.1 hypothetical protein D8M38_04225 [Kocuria sp. HSID17582]